MLSEIRSECQHNHTAHPPVVPVSVTTHAIPEVDRHVVDLDGLCLNGHKQKFITPCQGAHRELGQESNPHLWPTAKVNQRSTIKLPNNPDARESYHAVSRGARRLASHRELRQELFFQILVDLVTSTRQIAVTD